MNGTNPSGLRLLTAVVLACSAASALAVPAARSARASETAPRDAETTYTCDRTYAGKKGEAWGSPGCAGSEGALTEGPIEEGFLLISRASDDKTSSARTTRREAPPRASCSFPRGSPDSTARRSEARPRPLPRQRESGRRCRCRATRRIFSSAGCHVSGL